MTRGKNISDYQKAPETWQALQTEVAKILAECGLTVEVEKTVATVCGEVEIDVYAEKMIQLAIAGDARKQIF